MKKVRQRIRSDRIETSIPAIDRLLSFPTAAERNIELHLRQTLVQPRAGEVDLGGEEIGLAGQHLQVARGAASVTHLRQISRILRRSRRPRSRAAPALILTTPQVSKTSFLSVLGWPVSPDNPEVLSRSRSDHSCLAFLPFASASLSSLYPQTWIRQQGPARASD